MKSFKNGRNMDKTKTSQKAKKFVFDDLPIAKVTAKTERHDSSAIFKNKEVIKSALMQCFFENDMEGFIDILETFYEVRNRSRIAREMKIRRQTIYEVFRKGANPSFRKVMELAHAAVA